jgi:alkylated DNA repair dioxygenase AlkB
MGEHVHARRADSAEHAITLIIEEAELRVRRCQRRADQWVARGYGLDWPRMRHWNQVLQFKLFDSCQGMLADDERGRIAHVPGFVDRETAQAWFTELQRGVRWRSQRREMYDHEVVVPRLLGHFRLDPAPDATPTAVLEAATRVAAHLGVPFNSVGLNLYRDGRDSVAPHNDHLYDIREGFPIALLSLGATRRMTIREKAAPRRSIHVDLEAGSLLVMSYATQIHYTHGVPKTSAPVGERISLAFRVKPNQELATPVASRRLPRTSLG